MFYKFVWNSINLVAAWSSWSYKEQISKRIQSIVEGEQVSKR